MEVAALAVDPAEVAALEVDPAEVAGLVVAVAGRLQNAQNSQNSYYLLDKRSFSVGPTRSPRPCAGPCGRTGPASAPSAQRSGRSASTGSSSFRRQPVLNLYARLYADRSVPAPPGNDRKLLYTSGPPFVRPADVCRPSDLQTQNLPCPSLASPGCGPGSVPRPRQSLIGSILRILGSSRV